MMHFVVTNYSHSDRIYIIMSIAKERVDLYHKIKELLDPWYAVFVYENYEEADKRCEEMNKILKEKKEKNQEV